MQKQIGFSDLLLNLSAGKEGHISNLLPSDLETILDFIDRYKSEIAAIKS